MSEVERYKELFLQAVFADRNATVRKWTDEFCSIQQLDGVRSNGQKHPEESLLTLERSMRDVLWGYCSLTPFCGMRFSDESFLYYEELWRLITRFKSTLAEAATTKVISTSKGRIVCSVVEFDMNNSNVNSPSNAQALAKSLGFAVWPDVSMFDRKGDEIRASVTAATLFSMLYSPSLPPGSNYQDIIEPLDRITRDAVARAEANRTFFDPERYWGGSEIGSHGALTAGTSKH